MGDIEQKEFQFPANPGAAFHQLDQIDAEIKRLSSLKDKVRKYLKQTIPVNEVEGNPDHKVGMVDDVKRLSYRQFRVSHSKVLDAVIEELVPKTKSGRVDEIIAEHTKEIWVDRFSAAEEDDDDFPIF